jgi:hypothetical protein
MSCEHDYIVKDGASLNDTFKITLCKKCLEVKSVLPRNEKPKEASVWDKKDRRICRESVLKPAVEVALWEANKHPEATGSLSEVVLIIAEQFEEWVYRKEISDDTTGK